MTAILATPCTLVADDDAAIRGLLGVVLAARGYRPLLAASGEAALEEVRKNSGKLVFAIIDLYMPGMGGLETIHQLRRSVPGLPCCLTTGTVPNHDTLAAVDAILTKPFTVADIDACIQALTRARH